MRLCTHRPVHKSVEYPRKQLVCALLHIPPPPQFLALQGTLSLSLNFFLGATPSKFLQAKRFIRYHGNNFSMMFFAIPFYSLGLYGGLK